jgi:RNA polymerase sigma factor (sigma-70 family)
MTDSPPPDGDVRLVARCLSGDSGAWAALVQRYQRLVYTVARRAGLDDHAAADVFQAVFERLFKQLGQLRQPERLQAWVVTSAKREALALCRRQARNVSLDAEPAGDEVPDRLSLADDDPLPEQVLDDLQRMHRLRSALDSLDARCKGLLALLFADDDERLPYDEVSQRLDLPVGSIGPTRARCLGKLRKLYEVL